MGKTLGFCLLLHSLLLGYKRVSLVPPRSRIKGFVFSEQDVKAFYLNVDVNCENCFPKVKSNSFWVQDGHPLVVNCSIQNCESRYVSAQWWMKGKRVYGMDFTKRIYETNFLNYTKLVIDPVKSEDAGIFTCINNVDSTKNISILLNVGVPTSPTPPSSGVSQLLPLFKEMSLLIFIIYILK